MGMESATSPDDQTMIVATYQQRQSAINATVVELQRSRPGSILPSRTVSILLGEFPLVNDTQTDEICPAQFDESIDTGLQTPALAKAKALKRAQAMRHAERLRLGRHYSTSADARCLPFSTGRRPDLAQISVGSGPNEMPG